jgi:hypothetical protein
MYEMSTGRRPFSGRSPLEIMSQTVSKPVSRPSALRPEISDAMERVILTALAKDPGDRFQDTEEFDHHLTAAAVGRIPDDARPCRTRVGLPSVSPQPASGPPAKAPAARDVETAALASPIAAVPKPIAPARKPPVSTAVASPRGRVGRSSAPLVISPLAILFLLALGGAVYYLFFHEDPFTIVEHESRTGDSPGEIGDEPQIESLDSPEELDGTDPPGSHGESSTTTIWLEITPPNAVVLWNGVPIEERPLVVARGEEPGVLQVSAPGHVTQQRRVKPTTEQTIKFRLKRKGGKRKPGGRR